MYLQIPVKFDIMVQNYFFVAQNIASHMELILWLAIAILLILLFVSTVVVAMILVSGASVRLGFTSRPTSDDAKKYASDLYANAHLIRDGYKATRNKLPWIDPITFEDARKLQMSGNISPKMFESLFINV